MSRGDASVREIPPRVRLRAGGTHPTGMFSCYRPQRSCGKVMFLHLSVILFTGGGVWQTPPRPLQQTATAADGTHPTGMHSCLFK